MTGHLMLRATVCPESSANLGRRHFHFRFAKVRVSWLVTDRLQTKAVGPLGSLSRFKQTQLQ